MAESIGMDVRVQGGDAICTLQDAWYMPDRAAEIRDLLKKFGIEAHARKLVIERVLVDASSVAGYLSIETFKVLWYFGRFHGGVSLVCPAAHVAEHIRKYFPSVKLLPRVPDALRRAA